MTHRAACAVLLLLPLFTVMTAQANVDRIHMEPPHWWVGMHDPQLQLMIHGPNAAKWEITVADDVVPIVSSVSLDSPNYLFVTLDLANASPGDLQLELKKPDGQTLRHGYPLLPRSSVRRGFSPADVIYLITPDRFANGDPDNDSVEGYADGLDRKAPYGRHGGDLQGIIDRLDYMKSMGYTQIWLNPILENAQPEHSYHGYAQTDLYQVDPRFGDNALYRELVNEARERGIGVIQDIVLNHIGSGHPWMQDLPASDWINHGGTFVPTTHRRESLHDPHAAPSDVAAFQDGWFVPTMPDLNQRNPHLARYLIQHTLWWIEYAGLSGLRIDTFPYPDRDFTFAWANAVLAEYPNINIVGEEWSLNPAIIAYWQGTRDKPGVPSMMDFPLHDGLIRALNAEEEAWDAGWVSLYSAIANDFQYPAPENLVTFVDNHDMSRIYTLLNEDYDLYRMAMAFLLTSRGVPQLFYGDEILMSNTGTDSHGVIRSDFPGGWSGDTTNGFTGEGHSEKAVDAQDFVRKLANWRASAKAVTDGELTHFAPDNGVYVYFRHHPEQTVMVAMNRNAEATEIDTQRFSLFLDDGMSVKNILNGEMNTVSPSLTIPARGVLILEVQS